MVKHVVLFKFKAFETPEDKISTLSNIKQALENLIDTVPSLKSIEVGLNSNEKEEFDLVLTTTHDDWAGLQAYAVHPEHVKVGQMIGAHKDARSCVDYEF